MRAPRWPHSRPQSRLSAGSILAGAIRFGFAAAAGLLPETVALLAQMAVQPSEDRATLINDMISALILGGVWAKLDMLYVLRAHTSQASLLNWADPGTFTLAAIGSPIPTYAGVDAGWTGGGGTIGTQALDPSTLLDNLTHYGRNSAHASGWCLTASAEDRGSIGASALLFMRERSSGGIIRARINSTTNIEAANFDGTGHYLVNRSGANDVQLYKNGVEAAAQTTNASADIAGGHDIFFLDVPLLTDATAKTFAAFTMGASLSETEASALYNALLTYQAGL